ncbi:MAG TPA: hypothetical protein VN132_15845 [Bdellovibrio sp.]|nr:hypothetical protein [Bdellovibrio sp.]
MKKIIMFLSAMMSLSAKADIVCKAQTGMGLAVVKIGDSSVTVSGAALQEPTVYSQLSYDYDGHMTGMITAPGLALSYENWYGCIHNATITANFRSGLRLIQTVKVSQCSGGSTPDKICHVQ